jgi:hypothetical protein
MEETRYFVGIDYGHMSMSCPIAALHEAIGIWLAEA